jgi:hypothetical protein
LNRTNDDATCKNEVGQNEESKVSEVIAEKEVEKEIEDEITSE